MGQVQGPCHVPVASAAQKHDRVPTRVLTRVLTRDEQGLYCTVPMHRLPSTFPRSPSPFHCETVSCGVRVRSANAKHVALCGGRKPGVHALADCAVPRSHLRQAPLCGTPKAFGKHLFSVPGMRGMRHQA